MVQRKEDSLLHGNVSTLRVLLFLDEPASVLGLKGILKEESGFRVVEVCRSEPELVAAVRQHPHLIVYSLALDPDLSQVANVRRLAPESAVVLWAREFAPEAAHEAMRLGVSGFLSATSTEETVRECLRGAVGGEMWMERSLSNLLLHSRPVKLSRRQKQLLGLLIQGLKNRDIAAAMDISEGTVKSYLSTLFEKVGARDRFELALFGLKNLGNTRESQPERSLRMKAQFAAGMRRITAGSA